MYGWRRAIGSKLGLREAGMIATLRIQVLFHWESDQARQLATRLYRTFSVRPMGDGPRIPLGRGKPMADHPRST